jgi:hypothetical protein
MMDFKTLLIVGLEESQEASTAAWKLYRSALRVLDCDSRIGVDFESVRRDLAAFERLVELREVAT